MERILMGQNIRIYIHIEYPILMSGSRALILLLMFVPAWLNAQHQIKIEPMQQCPIEGYELKEVYVNVPETVGTVLKGPLNGQRTATIEPDIRSAIFNVLTENCEAKDDAIPIAIKVNALSIHEVSTNSEHAMATLNIDVLREEDGQWVHFFNSGGSVRSGGLDVTHHHGKNLGRLLVETLAGLQDGEARIGSLFPALAGEQLAERTRTSDLWIPIEHGELPVGLFKTFNDLRAGRTMKIDSINDVHAQAKGLRKEIWGYSDGISLYMWHGKEKIGLRRDGADFVGELNMTTYDHGAIVVGSVMFGLIGGLATGSLTRDEYSIPVFLDLMTGDLVGSPDIGIDVAPIKDVTHIIYLSRFGRNTDPLTVMDGDRVLATLEKDTYCEVRFTSQDSTKPLLLKGTAEENVELPLPLDRKGRTVHLVILDEEGRPALKPVSEQMKEKFLYSFREDQRRPLAFEPEP